MPPAERTPALGSVPDCGRRRVLGTLGAAALAMVSVRPARGTPETMADALREVTGGRTVHEGRVAIDLPKIADNGNVVPLTVRVDSPLTPEDHIRAVHVFSEQNPVPVIVQMFLGPHYPKGEVATRIRLAKSQRVIALAEMSDGEFWSAAMQVEVTISACGDD